MAVRCPSERTEAQEDAKLPLNGDFGVDDLIEGLAMALKDGSKSPTASWQLPLAVPGTSPKSVSWQLPTEVTETLNLSNNGRRVTEKEGDNNAAAHMSSQNAWHASLQGQTASGSCAICFDALEDREDPWHCEADPRHAVCSTCAFLHIRTLLSDRGVVPACPIVGCGHLITALDVHRLVNQRPTTTGVSSEEAEALLHIDIVLRKHAEMARRGAVPCIREGCGAWVVPKKGGAVEALSCGECGEVFCAVCKARPFHYHCSCEDVLPAAREWHSWLLEGREEYFGKQAVDDKAAETALADLQQRLKQQQEQLREAEEKLAELEAMEEWKAQNCRRCPSCQRVVEKLDGCDLMKCGQNWHGGDVQNGCGAQFQWTDAAPYKNSGDNPTFAKVRRALLDVTTARLTEEQHTSAGEKPRVACDACAASVVGPGFFCLHCPEPFFVCVDCVGDHTRLVPCSSAAASCHPGRLHRLDHVFRIDWDPHEGVRHNSWVSSSYSTSQHHPDQEPILNDGHSLARIAWHGPIPGFAYCQGRQGAGYYRSSDAASGMANQNRSRGLLTRVFQEVHARAGVQLNEEISSHAGANGMVSIADWWRCLFRLGIEFTEDERGRLLQILDPEDSGQLSLDGLRAVAEASAAMASFGGKLLEESESIAAGTGEPVLSAGELVRPAWANGATQGAQPLISRTKTFEIRLEARCLDNLRRQVAEQLFVCLGGTLLLKSRRPTLGLARRLAYAVGGKPLLEERFMRLAPATSDRPPALFWSRPRIGCTALKQPSESGASKQGARASDDDGASSDDLPALPSHKQRSSCLALPNLWHGPAAGRRGNSPSWCEESLCRHGSMLTLDHIIALVYAPMVHDFIQAVHQGLCTGIDRALIFSLISTTGRTYYFSARCQSELQAWVLTLSRLLRSRGSLCRVRSARALVARRMQVRVERLAESFGVPVGEVWMVALRRTALSLHRPFQEYEGRCFTCIKP